MPVSDADSQLLMTLFSEERLASLLELTKSPKLAIELHQDTLRLGASLMIVIATVEIALRNAVCENLTSHFAVNDWLLRPPAPFQWRQPESIKIGSAWDSARRAKYSKLSQADKHTLDELAYPKGRPAGKSHLQRSKDRRKYLEVSHGKVVAELTFYFWKRLYGPEYDQSLWRTTLKRTFPHKKVTRAEVAVHLENIYQARNRLAHHEPVLYSRFNITMSAIEFVVRHMEASLPSATTPLANLLAEDINIVNSNSSSLHAKLASYRNVLLS